MPEPSPSPQFPDSDSEATISQSPAPGAAPPPTILIDGYKLQNEISRGGQAVVYSAVFLKTGRRVAVKVMREGPLATENGRARFTREAQILASLNHPNIVTILDRGRTTDGSEFFAMDFIAGQSLDEGTWKRTGYLQSVNEKPAQPLQLFLKICDAVNAAHLRGIVHRDLKPSNIRLDERDEPHVLDFGLARGGISGESQAASEPVTITGQFLGSLPWASPEQAEGIGQKIDMRSDVYSLGVVLYQLVTGGHFPYQVVGSMRDVLNNIMTAEPPAPSEIMSHRESRDLARRARRTGPPAKLLNPALDAIILRALAKRRDDRYQSAGELARDIEAYLAGRPLSATTQAPAAPRNRALMIAGIAAAAALVIGITVWTTWLLTRAKPVPPVVEAPGPAAPASATSVAAAPVSPAAGGIKPPSPAPQAGAPMPGTDPVHPLVAASPLKSDYLEMEAILNRFIAINAYIHTKAPERIGACAAADSGDAVGQLFMGRCNELGEGIPQNSQEGARLLHLSAGQGLPMALCMLGIRYRASQPPYQDYAQAIDWYTRASDAGSSRAMVDLAIMYTQGLGTPVDYAAALTLLRKSAALGDPAAYSYLGDAYRVGNGVPVDDARALEYLTRAAEADTPISMTLLGSMYAQGRGVPRDFAIAMKWYQKADDEGLAWAANNIGDLYYYGSGVPQDYKTAARWYQKAANNSVMVAMRKLGALYEQGNGLAKDHNLAVVWYTKAAAAGDAEAKQWVAANVPPATGR